MGPSGGPASRYASPAAIGTAATLRPEQGGELGEHRLGLVEDVGPGVAAELVASLVGFAVAAAVLFPGVAAVVVAVGVEFDGELVGGPAAVDVVGAGLGVRFWQRQVVLRGGGRGSARSSLLSRTGASPRSTLRSRAAPGAFGRRSSAASTCSGVVPWRTAASWAARARSSKDSNEGTRTRVAGTVVTGMPRWRVASLGSIRRCLRVWMPLMRRSVRAVTSGGGAGPLISPHSHAADRPLNNASLPQALTAAM